MTGIAFVLFALLAAMAASELALRGTKLQTGLSRVVVAWALVYLGALVPLWRWGGTGPIAFTILWGGAFLSWFGIRSHIESSILLRMLYLLRERPMSEESVVSEYTAHYGQNMRLEELLRGKMAVADGDRLRVTPKGKTILGVVAKLR